ncbi:MAG: hypothetical protein LBT36_04785 [Oscillospiraceae bacterium]|jgi:hypothetical protein|nr:hypothetical protein [Oscillospiraceae bacterium]
MKIGGNTIEILYLSANNKNRARGARVIRTQPYNSFCENSVTKLDSYGAQGVKNCRRAVEFTSKIAPKSPVSGDFFHENKKISSRRMINIPFFRLRRKHIHGMHKSVSKMFTKGY